MKCSNCGAEFDDSLTVCPYCGAENLRAAVKEQNREIEHYREMAEDVSHLKERTAAGAAKKTNKTLLIASVIIAAALLSFLAVTAIRSFRGLNKEKEQLAACENYYSTGDYTALSSYLDEDVENYSDTFEKYRRAAALADNYEIDRQLIRDYLSDKNSEFCTPEEIAKELHYLFETMSCIQSYEAEGFKYGESDAVMYYKALYEDLLQNDLHLTEEETTAYTDSYSDGRTDADYVSLAADIITRLP